jgi:probable F420-dependent oxidoreductase
VKIGVNLINFGPGATPESMGRWARVTEALGYHAILTSDHVAITPDVAARYPAPFYEPFTTLGWLAATTRAIEIGTTVIIVPYRHPLETARMVANVDRLSGGRVIVGVGVGWARQEFETLGVPFTRRGALTNDYLAAMKAAWGADVASYEGRFVTFKDVDTRPRPVRVPHPPLWVGGASDAALRRAVLHGDAWHPIRIRIDWLRDRGLPRLHEIAEAERRPPPELCPRIRLRFTQSAMPEDERVAGEGTLDQVRRDFEALDMLGASYVVVDTYADDVEATRRHDVAFAMLATLAERVVDLERQSLR